MDIKNARYPYIGAPPAYRQRKRVSREAAVREGVVDRHPADLYGEFAVDEPVT
jgi:hypothetical protein